MVTNDLVPEGLIERLPPGAGEGVGGLNVGRAAQEDEPDAAERRRRARQKDVEPAPTFGAVAQSMPIAPGVERAQSAYQEALKRRAAHVAPQIEAAQQAAQQPRPPVEAAPAVTPPPSVGLTPFLSAVEGERPENTIAKLIQGVGLLAVGVAGRKDARAALAGLTGALQGWQAGDKERADRAFADWQSKSETLLNNWKARRQTWRDIMEDANLTQAQRNRMLELSFLKEGLPVEQAKADLEGEQYLVKLATDYQKHLDVLELARDKLKGHREESDRAFTEKVREFNAKQGAATTIDPATVTFMAEQGLTGHMPSFGMGGVPLRLAVYTEMARLAKERGIDPSAVPSLQASFRASETELKRIQSTRGPVMAFAKTIDKHMEQSVALSEKRDASGIPAWNRWINKGRMAIAGDTDITNFNFLLRETINEYAKATSSVSGGGAATSDTARKEIEDVLNSAMTKEQILSIFPQMKLALLNKQKGFEEQIGATVEDMRGYFKPAAKPEGTAGQTITLPDGTKVTVTP